MHIHRVARRVAVGAVLIAAGAGLGAAPASGASSPGLSVSGVERVVVVAVPGLRWADVNAVDTPNLFAATGRAARGALSVKAADAHTDCAAGMLTLGAGNRAASTALAEVFCRTSAPVEETVPLDAWSSALTANEADNFGTEPGALGDALAAAGFSVGAGRHGAALLAAAAKDGVVPGPPRAPGQPRPRLLVISDLDLYDVKGAERRRAARIVDSRLSPLLSGSTTLTIVVGAANALADERSLQLAMALGPGFAPGSLVSDSTERAPYVQLIDVAPTILTALGVAIPDEMAGRPWRGHPNAESAQAAIDDLASLEEDARQRSAWGGWFVFVLVVMAAGASLLACTVSLVSALRRRIVARRMVEALCLLVAAVPVASWLARPLVGWPDNAAVLFLTVALLAATIAVVAMAATHRRPPWTGVAVVAAVTATVLAVDFASGTQLQSESLLGDSTIVAGRFDGAGNTATSVFATSLLIATGVLAAALRRRGLRVVLLATVPILVLAVVLVGAPFFGNDFGGLLALVPAAVLFVLLQLEGRHRWALPAALVAGAVAAAALLAIDATVGGGHIGRFAEDLVGGDAGTTLDRKLESSLRSWHTSWYVVMVFVAVMVVAGIALARRRGGSTRVWARAWGRDAPTAGLLSAALCAVLGGVLNDSGVVVPGAAAVVAIPLVLAACLRDDPHDDVDDRGVSG